MHWIHDRQERLGLNKRFLYFNMISPTTRIQHSLKEWGVMVVHKTCRSHGLGNSPVSGISIIFLWFQQLSVKFSAPVHKLNTAMKINFMVHYIDTAWLILHHFMWLKIWNWLQLTSLNLKHYSLYREPTLLSWYLVRGAKQLLYSVQ